MTDKNSAQLYGILFEVLAEDPTEENKALAKIFFDQSDAYAFTHDQMDVDEALITLGLAKREIDPDFPDEGEQVLYLGEQPDDLPFW